MAENEGEEKKKGEAPGWLQKGCLGCAGVFVILFIIGLIGSQFKDNKTEEQKKQASKAEELRRKADAIQANKAKEDFEKNIKDVLEIVKKHYPRAETHTSSAGVISYILKDLFYYLEDGKRLVILMVSPTWNFFELNVAEKNVPNPDFNSMPLFNDLKRYFGNSSVEGTIAEFKWKKKY